jgi:hypothetical protein
MITQSKQYTLGKDGKLEEIKEVFTDLEPGAVIRWGGNAAWSPTNYCIVGRHVSDFGVSYHTYNMDEPENNAIMHRVEASSIKSEDDPDLWHGQHYYIQAETVDAETVAEYIADQKRQETARNKANEDAKAEADRLEAIGRELWPALLGDCKAVIIAEHEQNKSDVMTDYFASSTTDRVILAASKHKRDLFPEMRKAALLIEETQHLGPGKGRFSPYVAICETFLAHGSYHHEGARSPWHRELDHGEDGYSVEFETEAEAQAHIDKMGEPESINIDDNLVNFEWQISEREIENREKYTGGHGYYLGHDRYSGWQVSKVPLGYGSEAGTPSRELYITLAKRHDHLTAGKEAPKAPKAPPEPPAPEAGTEAPAVYIVEYEGEWTWLLFEEKPSTDVLNKISKTRNPESGKFFYSKRRTAWYAKERIAEEAIAVLIGEGDASPQAPEVEPVEVEPEVIAEGPEYIGSELHKASRLCPTEDRLINRLYYSEIAAESDIAPDFFKQDVEFIKGRLEKEFPPEEEPAAPVQLEAIAENERPPASLMVAELKENNQDFEWYPTTPEMIAAVQSRIPADTRSIMDIGAGDGRVLEALQERCEHADLYAIEKALPLVQAQGKNIIPVGTEFYEQNLAALQVEYIFCNPPYSDYEEWTRKIIMEGYAEGAFLVIPQRWADSKIIKAAIKKRGVETKVIYSGDFHKADRQARAKIDIVKITYSDASHGWGDRKPEDPFDVWFDQNIDTFDKAEEFKESETSQELARKFRYSTISEMVEAYLDEYGRLEKNYRAIFELDFAILDELGVNKEKVKGGLKKKMAGLKVKYWEILFNRLDAITSRLTTDSRKHLLNKLTANNKIDFTEQNAYAVVIWAIKNANQYFEDQAVNLFYELSTFDGVENYKSNLKTWVNSGWRYNARDDHSHYALDYRIVVSKYSAIIDPGAGDYDFQFPAGLHPNCHDLIADITAVMSNLGFSTYGMGSYNREWERGKWENFWHQGSDETLFQIKGYLNGNVHLRFMQDAIKALNVEVGRILKWLNCEQDVIDELGYSPEEAKKYFNNNPMISFSSVKLLEDSTI